MKQSQENQLTNKGNTIKTIIDWTLIIILIILVIYGQINGLYLRKEIHIIETCNGNPTNLTKMEELEKEGLAHRTPTINPIKITDIQINKESK